MKYCANCGKELFDEAVICPGCGTATSAYYKYVSSEKAFPTEKSSDSPTEQKSENCASENPTFNSNTNEAPEHLVSDEPPINSSSDETPENPVSDEAPENPVSDESPDEGTYDESPEYLVADESPDEGTSDDFSENDLTDDTYESTDSDEADSNSPSIQTKPKRVIPKKFRVVAIIAIAIILVVCSALSAVYVYKSNNIKGLSFNSVEAMESYANGYYVYDGKIIWIDGSNYGSCYFSDIRFDNDEYIDEANYSAKKLDFDIEDNITLIQHYIKKRDTVKLGYNINKGIMANDESNEKLFAVQGNGVLLPLNEKSNKEPIRRIEAENLLEESTELKSKLEAFRSDYEDAVKEAEAKKPKKAYFPTVDEYIGRFKKDLTSDFTRTNYYSDGYVLIKWKVKFNYSVTFSYQLMLYVNSKDEITNCTVSIVDTKFINKFSNLLNSDEQLYAYNYLTFPVYLLYCMHTGTEDDMDGFSKYLISKTDNIYSKGTSSGIYNGCELSLSLSDYVFMCSLDWGNAHEKSKN